MVEQLLALLASCAVLLIVLSALIGMITQDFLWLPRKLYRWLSGLPLRGLRQLSKAFLKWGKDVRKVPARGIRRTMLWVLSAPLTFTGVLLAIPADIFGGSKK